MVPKSNHKFSDQRGERPALPVGDFANDRDEAVPPSLGQVIFRIVRNTTFLAVAISLTVHVLGLLVSGGILLGIGGGDGHGPEGSGVQLAIITEAELGKLEDASLGATDPHAPVVTDSAPVAEVSDLLDAPPGDDMANTSTAGLGSIGGSVGGGDIGDGLGTGGFGSGAGGSGGGGASFFGVEARGNRIAYIVDVSGSMDYGSKMRSMKDELVKSVEGLMENARFFVVPYSSEASPLGKKREWTEASDKGKRWAKMQVEGLRAEGGTEPQHAFTLLFGTRPKPDAIYFMTDGEFQPEVADLIIELNAEFRIPIHCICFESRESEEQMKAIAAASGGSFTFVPGAMP